MPLAERIRRWWRVRRLHAAVATAARDPSRIDHVAESSGFDPNVIRQCVAAINESRPKRRLVTEKSVTAP
jgi:hypothetical protein